MTDPPFKSGDIVRLRSGKSSILVYEVDYHIQEHKTSRYRSCHDMRYKTGWYIRYQYLSSRNRIEEPRKWREAEDFILIQEEEPKMTKPTLYQTKKEPIRYGNLLTTNSLGQMVLEMKGENGACEGFDKEDIEIVTPYTCELTRIGLSHNEKRGATNSCHVLSKEGELDKDNVLIELTTGLIWRVTKIDSKCLSPRDNKSKWMKIATEFFTFGE